MDDDEQCVITVWYHSSEASYAFVTTGQAELDAFIEKVNETPGKDITGICPLNRVQDFGTGVEMGGELWE